MIRIANPEDAQEISRIFNPIIINTATSFATELPTLDQYQYKILEITKVLPWFVFEDEQKLLGYAYASPHRTHGAYRWSVESSVYVDQNSQGKGVARSLYEKLFSTLKRLGYYNVYAGVTVPNEPSVHLHESFGFRQFCTFPHAGYKLGKWHDVDWWRLDLQEDYSKTPTEPLSIKEL